MRSIGVAMMIAGCGPELPTGWESAKTVDSLVQQECGGSPYEGYTTTVESDLTGDPLEVSVASAHFRCAQDVEAFWQREGDLLEVLVQPVDMHPGAVAGCDCLYDLDIDVTSTDEPPTNLVVWRRWDALNEPNEPERLGSVVLGPEGPVPGE